MWLDISIFIAFTAGLVCLTDSYPAEDPMFQDGRPPRWNKKSTKENSKQIASSQKKSGNTTQNSGVIEGRIVGGVDADMGDLPYQVAVVTKDAGQICGGTVYNELYVLTAAHCLFEDGKRLLAKDLQIIAGELNLNKKGEGEQTRNVVQVIPHPSYKDKDGFNDVAIFKLAKPLHWTETVHPLRIAGKTDGRVRQDKALVSGWGYTQRMEKGAEVDEKLFPDALQMVDVKIISKPQCETLHKRKAYKWAKHPSFLCAGALEGNKDACQADSGGPLACFEKRSGKKFLCGVVANGIGCARKDTPGFYTDVAVFSDWIIKTAGKQKTI